MSFQVIIRPKAEADIEAAITWLERTSPVAAARWRASLLQLVSNLKADPRRFPLAEEAQNLGLELREMLHGKRRNIHRVLFMIEEQTVSVLRVRHHAQDRVISEDMLS